MIKADYTDKPIVIDILCGSFDTNKSVNYVVKQDGRRKERIRNLMDYSFELCYMFGEVLLSSDKKACALILFPDKKKTSLKTILLDVKLATSCIGITRVFKVLERDSKIKSFYPKHPVYYLWFIGVASDSQHKGIGLALLNDIVKESDSMQRPIYLETSMPENIDFYKKARFEVYNELDFGHRLFLIKKELLNK
jgi:ribosomal protein S18 acetylase RimI-like enzyme